MPSNPSANSRTSRNGQSVVEWRVGVEQEFLLVDPRTKQAVALGAKVADTADSEDDTAEDFARADHNPGPASAGTDQTEATIPIATLSDELWRTRLRLNRAARANGCRLVAAGAAPVNATSPRTSENENGADDIALCSCRIHIGPSDLDLTIEVSNRLRPWLPALVALSANSPVRHRVDTGYASWRYLMRSRNPVSGPPPFFESVTEYEHLVRACIDGKVLADRYMVDWDIRPSPDLPTIEFRFPDIPITVEEVELLAELTMALVLTAVNDVRREARPPRPTDSLLRAACLRAAQDGLSGLGISLSDGRLVRAWDLIDEMLAYIRPVLEKHNRDSIVDERLTWLRAEGCGADRQRRVLAATNSPHRLIDFLAEKTVAEW